MILFIYLFFIQTAWDFPHCSVSVCAAFRILGLDVMLRIYSDAREKLWAFDITSLFWTGRKGTSSVKQILLFFSLFLFLF